MKRAFTKKNFNKIFDWVGIILFSVAFLPVTIAFLICGSEDLQGYFNLLNDHFAGVGKMIDLIRE